MSEENIDATMEESNKRIGECFLKYTDKNEGFKKWFEENTNKFFVVDFLIIKHTALELGKVKDMQEKLKLCMKFETLYKNFIEKMFNKFQELKNKDIKKADFWDRRV